jgi:hypothetical protein
MIQARSAFWEILIWSCAILAAHKHNVYIDAYVTKYWVCLTSYAPHSIIFSLTRSEQRSTKRVIEVPTQV